MASATPGAILLNRFGLGARPEDSPPEKVAAARQALLAQFDRFEVSPAVLADLPDGSGALQDYQAARKALRNDAASGDTMAPPSPKAPIQALFPRTVDARMASALTTTAPFVERLVHFWSNHFCLSVDNPQIMALAGAFERDAIRPHVLGRFTDMALAVERHPAMLLYLNQAQSTGPNSQAARQAANLGRKAPGLNENLAREILELHTLGVRSGYSQADVVEFALALTGWMVDGMERPQPGRAFAPAALSYRFHPMRHEPGTRTILGRTYPAPTDPQQGDSQAAQAIADFAQEPQTARHIATKLARHFAGDTPPPALVDRLAGTFTRSGGDLPAVYRNLIAADEIWLAPPPKFKTPWEWLVSARRGLGQAPQADMRNADLLEKLGQPTWKPGSPAGWDDLAASWASGNALLRRVAVAQRLCAQANPVPDARALAPRLLPGACSPATLTQIAQAESPASALALLLVCPEFLRR